MINSNKSWADLVHENKKTVKIILFSILGIFLMIIMSILFLVTKGYDVTTSGITKQKKSQDSLTIKKQERAITETKKETIVVPTKIIEYRDRFRDVSKETKTIEKPSINITSTGQSGGITAQNVNIGKVVPELNENLKKSLLEAFPDKGEKIYLSYLMGSSNRMDFANKIQTFLRNEGYANINVGMMAADPEPKGISYNRKNGITNLVVGVLEE
ncbi:hypothetical protein [Flavobacterium aestivum]|uniref:hypothetical protein n=1 Tax=Flavobacterium aestivum TaxID=3003257 RepID=UPI0024822B85|nr:hypothetical protein [Flavobacterium aestivum]